MAPLQLSAIATAENEPYTTTDVVMVVNDTLDDSITYTCTVGGKSVPDTVTPTETGAPTTGGATATFSPDPVATGTPTTLKIATTINTDPDIYTIAVSGNGKVCPQYSTNYIDLTLDPQVAQSRLNLMTIETMGWPTGQGGTFAYSTRAVTGTLNAPIDFASGYNDTSDPNNAQLSDPANTCQGGAPCTGGLETVTTKFTVNKLIGATEKSVPNPPTYQVATFGMSCYNTTYENDWGTPPKNCKCVKISGVEYCGTVANPDGLKGTYCASFIAEAKLNGNAQLNSGQDIQYSKGKFVDVSQIDGADGTPVKANQTVARDRKIIPDKKTNITLDLDPANLSGQTVLANDIGGGIKGYRIDLYKGVGMAVCNGYANPMAVGACETTGQKNCPTSAVQ